MQSSLYQCICILLWLLCAGQSLAAEHASREQAVAIVRKAILYYQQHGREQSLPVFSDQNGPFRDKELFLVVMDMQGKVLSHASMRRMIGNNILALKDANGVHMVQDIIDKAARMPSGWSVPYLFSNPHTRRVEEKETYFERYDNLIFFCGIYKG